MNAKIIRVFLILLFTLLGFGIGVYISGLKKQGVSSRSSESYGTEGRQRFQYNTEPNGIININKSNYYFHFAADSMKQGGSVYSIEGDSIQMQYFPQNNQIVFTDAEGQTLNFYLLPFIANLDSTAQGKTEIEHEKMMIENMNERYHIRIFFDMVSGYREAGKTTIQDIRADIILQRIVPEANQMIL